MNKIVREHYPVGKLPEDLREGLDPEGLAIVTVTLEPATKSVSGLDIIRNYRTGRSPRYSSDQEIVDLVRRIRDGEPL